MKSFFSILCLFIIVMAAVSACDNEDSKDTDLSKNSILDEKNNIVEADNNENNSDNNGSKNEVDENEPALIVVPNDVKNSSLSVTKTTTGNGFVLQLLEDAQSSRVLQTFISPANNNNQLVVHIVRRIDEGTSAKFYKDAVVVNPETQEFNIYPMFEAYVNDTYNVDSVAKGYGFMDSNHLIYVAAVGEDQSSGDFTYRMEKLNILNGEKEIILSEIPDAPMDDFFSRGWLTEDKNTLFLNTHKTGLWWAVDVNTGQIHTSDQLFPHSWPIFLTNPSPDGQNFWYTNYNTKHYELYDLEGHLLSEMPFSKGYDHHPPFQWRDDNRYSAHGYTRDQLEAHIISDVHVYEIAQQGIQFTDSQGKQTSKVETEIDGEYVELASWLDKGDQVLLHYYKLAEDKKKITLRYERFNLLSGQSENLQTKLDSSELMSPTVYPHYQYGPIYWIDGENRIYVTEQFGSIIPDERMDGWNWLYDKDDKANSLLRFDKEKGLLSSQKIRSSEISQEAEAIVNDWLVWDDMNYSKLTPIEEE